MLGKYIFNESNYKVGQNKRKMGGGSWKVKIYKKNLLSEIINTNDRSCLHIPYNTEELFFKNIGYIIRGV